MPNTALGGLAAKLKLIRAEAEKEDSTPVDESPPPLDPVVPVEPDESLEPDSDIVEDGPDIDVPDIDVEDDGEGELEDGDDDPIDMFQELTRAEDDGPEVDILAQIVEPEPAVPDGPQAAQADGSIFGADYKERLQDLIEAYFRVNTNPSDEQVHALATSLGLDQETLEAVIYEYVGEALANEDVNTHEVGEVGPQTVVPV